MESKKSIAEQEQDKGKDKMTEEEEEEEEEQTGEEALNEFLNRLLINDNDGDTASSLVVNKMFNITLEMRRALTIEILAKMSTVELADPSSYDFLEEGKLYIKLVENYKKIHPIFARRFLSLSKLFGQPSVIENRAVLSGEKSTSFIKHVIWKDIPLTPLSLQMYMVFLSTDGQPRLNPIPHISFIKMASEYELVGIAHDKLADLNTIASSILVNITDETMFVFVEGSSLSQCIAGHFLVKRVVYDHKYTVLHAREEYNSTVLELTEEFGRMKRKGQYNLYKISTKGVDMRDIGPLHKIMVDYITKRPLLSL